MQHPDEGIIHTWLDGELSTEEVAVLEAHITECDECSASVAEARGFIAASSRIVSALDAVSGDVIPVARPAKRFWYLSPQFRAAAAVLVVAGASLLVMRTGMRSETMAVVDSAKVDEVASERSAAPMSSAAATLKAPSPQPPVVTGNVTANSKAFGVPLSNLNVVRVDSSATGKKITYQSLSGSEVVLTEREPASVPPGLSKVSSAADESMQRAAVTGVATTPVPVDSNAPAATTPAAQRANVVHTINWVDPVTRRRYSLTGPVSVEELETIKARLLKAKR